MIRLDPFDVYSVKTGTFRLDGGAMFGVVPKVLWDKTCDVDSENRIPLSTRSLLAVDRAGGRVVIADTGCGSKWEPKQAARFAIQHDSDAIKRTLAVLRLSPLDVTDLVVTHLHFDHNGGLTEWDDDPRGPTRLCFPRARHWIHRRQWEHAFNPSLKDRASYLREDFQLLSESDLLRFVDGDDPPGPFPGLNWIISHGHTPYQLHPVVGSDKKLLFCGDIVPTVAHFRQTWVMAYDVLPLTTMAEKARFSSAGIDKNWILALSHDPEIAGVEIDGTVDRPIVTRVIPLDPRDESRPPGQDPP